MLVPKKCGALLNNSVQGVQITSKTMVYDTYNILWLYWLVVAPPLWKIRKSVGMIIPNIWENTSHVPNHQPAIVFMGFINQPSHHFRASGPHALVRSPGVPVRSPGPESRTISVKSCKACCHPAQHFTSEPNVTWFLGAGVVKMANGG